MTRLFPCLTMSAMTVVSPTMVSRNECWRLSLEPTPLHIQPASNEATPVCLDVPALKHGQEVNFEILVTDPKEADPPPLIQITVDYVCCQSSQVLEMKTEAKGNSFLLSLNKPVVAYSYEFLITVPDTVSSYSVVAFALPSDSPSLPPSAAPSSPSQKQPSSVLCKPAENSVFYNCRSDLLLYCSSKQSHAQQIGCLEVHQNELSGRCLLALERLSDCEYKGMAFQPVQIASMLLLAAASLIILCTVVRCCCRYACGMYPRVSNDDSGSLAGEDELGELEEDEEGPVVGSVAPLQTSLPADSKVRQEAKMPMEGLQLGVESEEDEEDDSALPSYTQVVDNAMISSHLDLQVGGSSSRGSL